jgi:methyltransferase (TIGR00027 family)
MENKAARTALGPIFQVALEQWVPEQQRLIHDPVAYQFLPAYLKTVVNACRLGFIRNALLSLVNLGGPGIRGGILCRKRYISDVLNKALNQGIHTVVVLGCGFDTLVYRESGLSSRQVYEVDLPQVIQAKETVLHQSFGQVPVHVKLVSMDFEAESIGLVLQRAGYSMDLPAFFIWEGVTQYIPEEAVRRVFEFLKQVSPGSQLVFTFIRKDFIDGKRMYGQKFLFRQTRTVKQLWRFGLEPAEIGAFLDFYMWKELDQAGSAEYQQRYLTPLNRSLSVMEVERVVHAERIAD